MGLKETMKLVSGMGMLLTGRKMTALAVFGKGFLELEAQWRERHPEVPDTMQARWEAALAFYDETHQDPTNRLLHQIGIPMIVGGAVGLLLSNFLRPLWLASAATFSVGWTLNLVGHALFEKAAPAFADDPLSFIAGPVWDLKQLLAQRRAAATEVVPVPPLSIEQATLN